MPYRHITGLFCGGDLLNMNICLLNDTFPPTIDGVANATYNYADIRVRDVARIEYGTEDVRGMNRSMGRASIGFSIVKQRGSDHAYNEKRPCVIAKTGQPLCLLPR